MSTSWGETATPSPDYFDIVVIDPGHGGHDHGARGERGLVEKDLVLDISLRAAEQLRRRGVTVLLTREEDRFVDLEERTQLANRAKADLFVSVHANSSSFRNARGPETFFASLEATDEAARELASRENLALGAEATPNVPGFDPVAAILGKLADNESLRESQEFAKIVQTRFSSLHDLRSRGVKQAPFVVLMNVEMPAALLELGFVTNAREAEEFGNEEYRDELAGALVEAVVRFGARRDARRGLTKPGTSKATGKVAADEGS
ncbi:MAG: N-acetylmuramoyl-L-alanine amidase [Myxococcales bacterium]|nr:N-acetylmuramoyl-L-alanine amidase [Myxococcales bacterium]